jgi:hypothetical protein
MTSVPTPPAAALVAEAIARIDARRETLDRLARTGVDMVERLSAGETVEIAGRKPFDDPARAFVVISRAVRFCLALGCRLDEALIDLLRGGPIPDLAILAPQAPVASKSPDAPVSAPESAPEAPAVESGPRARIARAVDAAIEAETGDREAAERQRGYVREHLIEGEDYDALLHQPWRAVVQAICFDLGLNPDWSAWDDTAGFAEPLAPRVIPPPQKTSRSPLAGEGGRREGSGPTVNDRFRGDNPS